MFKKILTISTAVLLLSSCGEQSEKVEPLKRGDKNLSCPEVQLEINEAEFYKKQAFDKKKLGVKNIIMPLGYIDTYMSADEAVAAADSRISYLNRIYDIKGCNPANSDVSDAEIQNHIQNNMQAQQMQQMQPMQMQQQPPVVYGYPQAGPVYTGAPVVYQGQGY